MATAGRGSKFLRSTLLHFSTDGVVITETPVDVGLLGTVVEGRWMGAKCAIKRLRTEDTTEYLSDRFLYECTLWSELKHPNVLQFYGVHFPLVGGYPVIVTELLQHNLNQYLPTLRREAFPLITKAHILRDVSLAVRYLHSRKPAIVMRELSASFIYLTPSLTAKLGEFGTATKLENNGRGPSDPQGTLPVTGSCSWPEPYSSFASDAFSFGDLIIHVLLHAFPEPGPKVCKTGDDKCEVVRELQRRDKQLKQLTSAEKNFQPILAQCFADDPKSRPTFAHLCASLDLVISHLSGNARGHARRNARDVLQLQAQLRNKEEELRASRLALTRMQMSVSSILNGQEPPEPQPTPPLPRRYSPCTSVKNVHRTSRMSLKDEGYSTMRPTINSTSTASEDSDEERPASGLSSPSRTGKLDERFRRARSQFVTPTESRFKENVAGSWQSPSPSVSPLSPSERQLPLSPGADSSIAPSPGALNEQEGSFTYALMKQDYKNLQRGKKVVIYPGGWVSHGDKCFVQTEQTGECQEIYPASKYLEVLRPIREEVWFSQMGKEEVERHMRKAMNPEGSFLVREGANGYVLAVKHCGKPCSYQIFCSAADQTYSLNPGGMPNYITISELVQEYRQKKMGLVTLLTVPYISMRTELPRESFSMDEEIHQGKHLVVWSGKFAASRDKSTTATAVKTIVVNEEQHASSKAALYNEASLLNFISRSGGHANILNMFGICVWGEQPHLVVELCYDLNLQQIMKQHGDIYSSEHLTRFGFEIASAMAFLEEKGIVHRDLRAANILVTNDADCKLSGFHCALTAAKAEEGMAAKTYAMTANPRWTAPEVYTGEVPYTSKSDVWSFGTLLIELFSQGSEPYHHVSLADVKAMLAHGTPPDIPHNCPLSVQSHIKSCLQINQSDRPSFSALMHVLDQ